MSSNQNKIINEIIRQTPLVSNYLKTNQSKVSDSKSGADDFLKLLENSTAEIDSILTPPSTKLTNQVPQKELLNSCQELESVFVYQMLRSMRSTVPKESLFGDSVGLDIFESMLDEEYSKEISRSGNFGLAKLLYNQLVQK
jgi:flagellar protein FlgJ